MVNLSELASFVQGAAPYAEKELARREQEETRLEALKKKKQEQDAATAERVRVLRAQEEFDADLFDLNQRAQDGAFSNELYKTELERIKNKYSTLSGVSELNAVSFRNDVLSNIRRAGQNYENSTEKAAIAYQDADLVLRWQTTVNGLVDVYSQSGHEANPEDIKRELADAFVGIVQELSADSSIEGQTRAARFQAKANNIADQYLGAYSREYRKVIKAKQESHFTRIAQYNNASAAEVRRRVSENPEIGGTDIARALKGMMDADTLKTYAQSIGKSLEEYYPEDNQNTDVATILGAYFREKYPEQSTDTDAFDRFQQEVRSIEPEKLSALLDNVLGEDTGGRLKTDPTRLETILNKTKSAVESFRLTKRQQQDIYNQIESDADSALNVFVPEVKKLNFKSLEGNAIYGSFVAALSNPNAPWPTQEELIGKWEDTKAAGSINQFGDSERYNPKHRERRDKFLNAIIERRVLVGQIMNGTANWQSHELYGYNDESLMDDALRFTLGDEKATAMADPTYFNMLEKTNASLSELSTIVSEHKFLPPSLLDWVDRFEFALEQGRALNAPTGEAAGQDDPIRVARIAARKNLQSIQRMEGFMDLPNKQRSKLAQAIKNLQPKEPAKPNG